MEENQYNQSIDRVDNNLKNKNIKLKKVGYSTIQNFDFTYLL